MASSNQSLKATFSYRMRLWLDGLIRPHPAITDPDQRMQARLSSALLLVNFLMIGLLLCLRLASGNSSAPRDRMIAVARMVPVIVFSLLGYGVSRSSRYRLGILILVVIGTGAVFSGPLLKVNPSSIRNSLSWLVASFMLCGLVFQAGQALAYMGVTLAACVGLAFWLPPALRMHVAFAFIFLITNAAFIVIGIQIRNRSLRERKEVETRLRERQILLTQILANIPYSVFWKDRNGTYLGCNEHFAREASVESPEQVAGKTDFDLPGMKSEADLFRRADREVIDTGKPIINLELDRRDESGRCSHLIVSKVPLRDDTGAAYGMLGIHADITEMRRTKEELAEHQIKMIVSSKMYSLGKMASELAHEVNNPLAIIQAKAAQLRDRASRNEATPDLVLQNADRIDQTVDRIAKIVRSMRVFARDGTNDPFHKVSACQIVEGTVDLCLARFQSSGVPLHIGSIPESLDLECRSVQISEVLLNLLNNAHDAVVATEKPWVRISVSERGDRIEFSVTDSGDGIPLSLQPLIMQPFFTTKSAGLGTGLGLSVAQSIVLAHRGNLYVDNDSRNTRFNVVLPRYQK